MIIGIYNGESRQKHNDIHLSPHYSNAEIKQNVNEVQKYIKVQNTNYCICSFGEKRFGMSETRKC